MLSIYFRPDRTQLIQAEWTKDKQLKIDDVTTLDEALPYIVESGQVFENRLQEYFRELKKETSISSEEVYIVLPDYIFSFIDSFEITDESKIKAIVAERTGGNAESLYITTPIKLQPPATENQVVYAIRKEYIDRIVTVAMHERITLMAIEPASMAFFRSIRFAGWRREIPFVELFPDTATIVTFSPVGGAFRQEVPMLAEKNILKEGPQADSLVHQAFSANDYTVTQTFSNFNTDMEYYTVTYNKKIYGIQALRLRMPEIAMTFPDFVTGKLPPKDEQKLWLVCLGTLLQESTQVFADQYDNPIMQGKSSFIILESANLLPDQARKAIQKRQWKQTVQRGCKFLSAALIIMMLVEAGAIMFFSSYELKPDLQRDYAKAKQDIAAIQVEMDVIKIAEKENQNPVEALAQLNSCLPDKCGITEVSIGNGNIKSGNQTSNKKKDGADKNNKTADTNVNSTNNDYIVMQAAAGNELILQDFNAQLSSNETFANPFISNISAASNGMKIAKFTIGRGTTNE